MDVYADFSQAKLEPNEDISDLVNHISASYQKLKELKYTLEDFQVLALLHALPAPFEATVTMIIQRDKSEWNFEKIKVNLIEAQQCI